MSGVISNMQILTYTHQPKMPVLVYGYRTNGWVSYFMLFRRVGRNRAFENHFMVILAQILGFRQKKNWGKNERLYTG